jgi:hypothetical protein
MEHLTTLVSSRGLLRSCDSYNVRPRSSVDSIDSSLLERHAPGGSIYVCTDALLRFANEVLPNISSPFLLVTGDSDTPIDVDFLSFPHAQAILGSPYLIEWFAQNLATQHDALRAIPIGQDYHTVWERPGVWGLGPASPIAQEHQLIDTFRQAPDINNRYPLAYCNWHFEINRGDRRECFSRAEQRACFYEPARLPRLASWARQAEFMFVLSPSGMGFDCHRTWEALSLGCIPIVKRNGISNLFRDLPVILIDDWCEVTATNLQRFYDEISTKKFDMCPLFLTHWVQKFRNIERPLLPPMTMSTFKRLITHSSK